MRRLSLALGSLLIGASACSLLLDTESLRKGSTTTGSTGAGGGADIDAGDDGSADAAGEGGKACTSDTDCLPGLDVDGCSLYVCGADQRCEPPKPNSGKLGIVSTGAVETVTTANEIGYPSLLADGTDLIMAVWHRTGTVTDVLFRKYPAYPQGPADAELSALATGMFRSYDSSPGLISRPAIPRKIRLLLAADGLADAGQGGMHLLDIDVPTLNNNMKLSAMQPATPDLGVTGYDTKPRAFPPRLMANGLLEPTGMWIQQQKLYYFDGSLATEAFSAKRVLGFVPLAGGGVHAALQTAATGAATGVERTELWSQGSTTLVALDNDQPAPRRGVTGTSTAESGLTANLVGWAFEPTPGAPQADYTAAICAGASCSSIALSMISGGPDSGASQSSILPGAQFPELTSARVTGSMVDRDVLQAFEISVPDKTQSDVAVTALFAGATRFNIPSVDFGKSTTTPMNPSLFLVDLASASTTVAPSDVLGPASVAITSDGQILIAWVVHPSTNMAVLKARRYQVKTCP